MRYYLLLIFKKIAWKNAKIILWIKNTIIEWKHKIVIIYGKNKTKTILISTVTVKNLVDLIQKLQIKIKK